MNFFLKRLFSTIPVVVGVVTITFFLIHMIPGDPIDIMLGDNASPIDKELLRRELGLDQPIATQFSQFVIRLSHFDLGRSLQTHRPVLDEIKDRLPATLELTLATLFFSLIIGIPLGVFAALKKGTSVDNSLLVLGMVGLSMPAFWLGPILIWLFALHFDWFPVSERGTVGHVILPALTLSSGIIAILLRMTRTSMLDVIKEDYIRVARAKGVHFFKLYFFHALINAVFPLLTILGLVLGALLTGTVIIETIFDWPGIGTLIFEAIQQRDYPVVQGCVLVISLIYVSVNFLTDLSYKIFNPKVSFD
ncbi:MAG: ABC transporter permease [Bdellovibrionales bacterium]|nr:ABC transporter permease [Bdellovibrionales bacterium]